MAPQMRFGLLGPVEVRRDGVAVPLHGDRQRVVLSALLLRAGQVVTVEELAEALWTAPPRSARVTVQNYVKRLRQALGPDAGPGRISTQCGGYLLQAQTGELDVSRFEERLAAAQAAARQGAWERAAGQARSALALWRGEPLAGVHSDLLATRDVPRLAELRLQAQELRIDADLHQGRQAEVIAETHALVAAHPLRERLHGLLMLALYRDGRQAEALAAYQAVRTILAEELGTEPGPGLARLHLQILNADPALQLPYTPQPHPSTSHSHARPAAMAAAPGMVVIVVIATTAGTGMPAAAARCASQPASGQLPPAPETETG